MPSQAALRAARVATRLQFFCLGAVAGTWGVHVPSAKAHFKLDDTALSLALLAMAAGAVLMLLRAGALVARFGPRAGSVGAGVLMCAALALVLASGRYGALLAVMLALGAGTALFDVAINTEGAALESLGGRKVMSGFHAMFSLGGMAAAVAGAWLLGSGVTAQQHLGWAAALLAATVVAAGMFMLPFRPDPAPRRSASRWPRGALLVLGLLGAAGLLAEGAMYDWSVLYLHAELGAPQSLAALGYASFSAAMAAARFGGDALRSRFDAAQLLAASGLLAALAMALVLLAADRWIALAGFALVGIGLANVVPILFIGATRISGVAPAAGIAAVSSIGYLGFLSGPPLVGAIAGATSLALGLGVVVAASALLAWGARFVDGRPQPADRESRP